MAGALATMLLGAVKVRKNWGIRAAIPFILVVGLGPQFIFYNVDVRMYSWMIFFVTGAVLFAYDLLRENKIVCWVLFVLLSLGGVYTQYFAVVPLLLLYLMLFLYFLIYERKRTGNSYWQVWQLCWDICHGSGWFCLPCREMRDWWIQKWRRAVFLW